MFPCRLQAQKYAFKCHRKTEDGKDVVYPVNAMSFHPIGTFATGGAFLWLLNFITFAAVCCNHRLEVTRFVQQFITFGEFLLQAVMAWSTCGMPKTGRGAAI